MSPVERLVRRIAVWDLVAPTPAPLRATGDEAVALVRRLDDERLTGPAVLALAADALSLPRSGEHDLLARHAAALAWSLRCEVRLLEVDEALREAGVRPLVLKGPAVAHLDEPDPALRTFVDVDVLVAPGDVDLAVRVLGGAGAVRRRPELRPGFDRRFAKSVTLAFADGVEVDLHRLLCDGVHGARIPGPELFARAVPLTLAGHRLDALDARHRVLHAAHHAVLGSPRPPLRTLRDLAGMLGRDDLSPATLEPDVARWQAAAVLRAAVVATAEELPVRRHELGAWWPWAESVPVGDRERRLLARQRAQGSGVGRARIDWLLTLPPRDAAAAMRALVLPDAAHLAARGRRRRDHLGHLARRATRRSRAA